MKEVTDFDDSEADKEVEVIVDYIDKRAYKEMERWDEIRPLTVVSWLLEEYTITKK